MAATSTRRVKPVRIEIRIRKGITTSHLALQIDLTARLRLKELRSTLDM